MRMQLPSSWVCRFGVVATACCLLVVPAVAFSVTEGAGPAANAGAELTARLQRLVQPSAATASSDRRGARSVGGAPALVVGAGLIDADAAAGTFAGLLRVVS